MKYIRKRQYKDYFYHYSILFGYKIPKYLFNKCRGKKFIHFIHIPKTGGTALKVALKEALVSDDVIIIFHSHLMKLSFVPPGDQVFFFVRDPITRFVSAFNMRKRMLTSGHRKYLLPMDIEIFKRFRSAEEIAQALSSSDKSRNTFARKTLNSMFFVKDRLTEWLISPEYLMKRKDSILFIGRQEHLESDCLDLKKSLGIKEDISLPSDPELSNIAAQHQEPLSTYAKEKFREFFSKDYEIIATCERIRLEIDIRENNWTRKH